MKYQSHKARAAMEEARPTRDRLAAMHDRQCWACGYKSHTPLSVSCHEILNGPDRMKTLGEPCSLLVLCWTCNSDKFTDKNAWPAARQLALLQEWNPDDYDLERFLHLRNPKAPLYIEQWEVDGFTPTVRKRE